MYEDRLEILRARLLCYYQAEKAVLAGQSYEIEGLRLTRADLGKITSMIAKLENEIEKYEDNISRGYNRSRIRYVVPVDNINSYRLRRFSR